MSMENMMDDDELANAFAANLAQLHAKIAALGAGSLKRRLDRLAKVAHGALEQLQEEAMNAGMIQPYSGGDPKPPEGP